MKWWHAALAAIGVLLLVAILFPAFAKAKSSTGKPNEHLWVAEAIQVSQLVRHTWPEKVDEVRPYLRKWRPFEFSVTPKGYEGNDALYEISVEGRPSLWRVKRIDAPKPEAVRR